MSMMWTAIATTAVGTGASLYGANKQAKAVQAANDQNAKLQAEQNQSAWNAYLLSRGINPTGATTGQIPANAPAVNTKLPLWATVKVGPSGKIGRTFTMRGMGTPSFAPPASYAPAPGAPTSGMMP